MAVIGNLGALITFEVSSEKVFTFNNYKRSTSGKWVQHDIIGKRPKLEFLGEDAGEVTFEIKLIASPYIKPWDVLKKIRKSINTGTPHQLVVGGNKVGAGKWVITNCSEEWDAVVLDGKLASAKANITIKEYL